ncbi:MAG: hypothetical protein ACRDKL_11610 [Solirubrobacteraceae bacterium]
MQRRIVSKLALPAAMLAVAVVCAGFAQAAAAHARPRRSNLRSGTVSGAVTAYGGGQITVQTPGAAVGVINAMTVAANRVAAQRLPYVWGGGHGQVGVPSIGARGPGFNGRRIGYDCSGAVAAVLAAAGVWPGGSGVPNDAGMVRYLLRHHLIVPGAGVGPREVTLYDDPGAHIFMNIDGRFWGTSDGGAGANPRGGPGWLDDGAYDATQRQYRRYHFRAALLGARTSAAYSLTFGLGSALQSLPGLGVGTHVSVAYTTSRFGTMVAGSINYTAPPASTTTTTTTTTTPPPTATAAGAVTAIAAGNASFTILVSGGQPMIFQVSPGSSVAQQLSAYQIAAGATVTVTYSGSSTAPSGAGSVGAPTLTAVSVTVNSPPPPPVTGGAAA